MYSGHNGLQIELDSSSTVKTVDKTGANLSGELNTSEGIFGFRLDTSIHHEQDGDAGLPSEGIEITNPELQFEFVQSGDKPQHSKESMTESELLEHLDKLKTAFEETSVASGIPLEELVGKFLDFLPDNDGNNTVVSNRITGIVQDISLRIKKAGE